MNVPDRAAGLTAIELQDVALARMTSARDTIDRAQLGDPIWFCSDSARALAELLLAASADLAAAEARA